MSGPAEASPGSNVTYKVEVINRGPAVAQNVQLTNTAPANATFQSETQVSGPAFSCANPPVNSPGNSTCSASSLSAGETAVFQFTYKINGTETDGAEVINTAQVSSATTELHSPDNTSSSSTVAVVGAQECTVSCSGNISVGNDPNQCGAVVSYSAPTGTGSNCGAVICTPSSGAFFPIGSTLVVCGGDTGPACTFTVTVNDTRPQTQRTIMCSNPITVNENPEGSGSAVVNYPAPTATGNCITVECDPPSGASFPLGATVVSCTVTDSSNQTASCSFTVTVISASGCSCPADITVSNDEGQCGAAVTYTSPSGGGCGTVSCTPASGSFFAVGSTTVNCTTGGGNCSFTVTVEDAQPPAITLNGSDTITVECHAAFIDPGATASDNCALAGPLVVSGSVNTDVPDIYVLTYSVSDTAGNDTVATRTV